MRGAPVFFVFRFQKLSGNFFLLSPSGATEVTSTEGLKFDGHAGPSANYEEKVHLRKRISAMGPEKEAARSLFHMSDVARNVCLPAGRGVIGNLDVAELILKILRDRFAPDAIDSISQDMAKFMFVRRAGQTMGT